MSDIHCLVYSSKISLKSSLSSSSLATLAQEQQKDKGVTGFYCYGNQSLFHYAEGSKSAIETLLVQLTADKRYKKFKILNQTKRPARLFSEWSIFITTFDQFVTAYSQAHTCIPFSPETWNKKDSEQFIEMFLDYYQNYDYQNHPNHLAATTDLKSLSSHKTLSSSKPTSSAKSISSHQLKPSRDLKPSKKYRRLETSLSDFTNNHELSMFIKLIMVLVISIIGMLIFNLSFADSHV